MRINQPFLWERQPRAEAFVGRVLDEACRLNIGLATLQHELLKITSTRLFDWLDHVMIGYSQEFEDELNKCGFVSEEATPEYRVFYHPGAQLPKVLLKDHDHFVSGVAVKVESIADFLMVRGKSCWIEGSPFSGYRRALVNDENKVAFWVVERRGGVGMEPLNAEPGHAEKYLEALEKWKCRPRSEGDEDENMRHTLQLAEEIVKLFGAPMAAWLVLEGERKYWQAKNTAGQIQKNRQDRLGMGWANHDHHTFRSSRHHFSQLVRLFEILGFHCREKFYAGEEAGWGAQVMENTTAGLVLFLDLDLDPNEVEIDIAHLPLGKLKHLGTIGLWCGLHGDSILKAGMHHLEAQFMFEELTEDLSHLGIKMMNPFSDFPFLKQAFTHGEVWTVDKKRVQKLIDERYITHEEADKFIHNGAVGSHLENLQRREGYKGFNQKNVSTIIKKTNPRFA